MNMQNTPRVIRVDTHRITEMESCAEEGGRLLECGNKGQGCQAACEQGRKCPSHPIQSVESQHPWVWALYGVTLLVAVLVSHAFAQGWIKWPQS